MLISGILSPCPYVRQSVGLSVRHLPREPWDTQNNSNLFRFWQCVLDKIKQNFSTFSLDVFSIDNWSTVFLVNSVYFQCRAPRLYVRYMYWSHHWNHGHSFELIIGHSLSLIGSFYWHQMVDTVFVCAYGWFKNSKLTGQSSYKIEQTKNFMNDILRLLCTSYISLLLILHAKLQMEIFINFWVFSHV